MPHQEAREYGNTMKWYYDDKIQMLLNTWFPNRKRFRAHWDSETGKWVES